MEVWCSTELQHDLCRHLVGPKSDAELDLLKAFAEREPRSRVQTPLDDIVERGMAERDVHRNSTLIHVGNSCWVCYPLNLVSDCTLSDRWVPCQRGTGSSKGFRAMWGHLTRFSVYLCPTKSNFARFYYWILIFLCHSRHARGLAEDAERVPAEILLTFQFALNAAGYEQQSSVVAAAYHTPIVRIELQFPRVYDRF